MVNTGASPPNMTCDLAVEPIETLPSSTQATSARSLHTEVGVTSRQRSNTRRSVLDLLTQIIIILFEARSSGDKMKSR